MKNNIKKISILGFLFIAFFIFAGFSANPVFAENEITNEIAEEEIISDPESEPEPEEEITEDEDSLSEEEENLEEEPDPEPEPELDEEEAPDPEPEQEEDADQDALLFIEENIILKNGCEVEDTDGTMHIFPSQDLSGEFIAICALAEALEQGFVDDIEFVDFGFGLFVNSINGISQENAYWKLHLNALSADVGASQLELEEGDVVSLVLTAFHPLNL